MKHSVVVMALAITMAMSCVNSTDFGVHIPNDDQAAVDLFEMFGKKKKKRRSKTVGNESDVRSSEIAAINLGKSACRKENELLTVPDAQGFYIDADGKKKNIFTEFGAKKKPRSHKNTASEDHAYTQPVVRQHSAPILLCRWEKKTTRFFAKKSEYKA